MFVGHYRYPGANRFDGAPGMFIIHSSTAKGKGSDDDDDDSSLDVDAALGESVSVSGMYMENLFTPDVDVTGITDERMKSAKINPLGIDVRTTKNGSMEQGIFLDYSNHFVGQLPSDQGKNQQPGPAAEDASLRHPKHLGSSNNQQPGEAASSKQQQRMPA